MENTHTFLNTLGVLAVFALLALPSLVGHLHDRRVDRQLRAAERGGRPQLRTAQAQNSSSNDTEPSTATWYADGLRSKKLVSS
ncbi:hypothetical protein QIS99_06720 [Streptomyces sp. B-S-A8]|uniref:Uncharacterized protein n=1 Tax=Streptomyces solicavernae TaxID=3043614 RepID=A0ABT6RNC5_9ACTN|nr:hypothetical protein [Streptomyces sp. B-S-A8]MDI3385912.1 hypothetical protein [Streptomyces sp. B-S-A8]